MGFSQLYRRTGRGSISIITLGLSWLTFRISNSVTRAAARGSEANWSATPGRRWLRVREPRRQLRLGARLNPRLRIRTSASQQCCPCSGNGKRQNNYLLPFVIFENLSRYPSCTPLEKTCTPGVSRRCRIERQRLKGSA